MAPLAERPTHLREILTYNPTWIGPTDASLEGMGGVCRIPTGECHIWILAVNSATKRRLLTDANPSGEIAINNLELAAYIAHLHPFAPKMAHLHHIRTLVDNTAAEGWA